MTSRAGAEPSAAISSPATRRADDPGGVEGRAVEADRVGQVVARRPSRRRTPAGPGCRTRCRRRTRRRARTRARAGDAGDRQHAEHAARRRPCATWVTVSTRRFGNRSASSPAYGREQQHRQELQPGGDAERRAGVVGAAPGPASPGRPAASRCRCWRRSRRWRRAGSCGPRGRGRWGSSSGSQSFEDRGCRAQDARARPGSARRAAVEPRVAAPAGLARRPSAPASVRPTSDLAAVGGVSVGGRPAERRSRRSTVRVMDGGCTRSWAASSPMASASRGVEQRAEHAELVRR